MVFVVFVCPNFTANAVRFIDALSRVETASLGIISQEPLHLLPEQVRQHITGFRQVGDVFDVAVLFDAAAALQAEKGGLHRLIAAVEPLQTPVARVREQLGIAGMREETALNFRDKDRMKQLFRQAGIPCAAAETVTSWPQALAFTARYGYPVVVKPPDGAGSLATFKVQNEAELGAALGQMPGQCALLEEFITGDEHSFDTFSLQGKPVFHSLSRYLPNPLVAMREPWIQWQVIIPREVEITAYDDIRQEAFRALEILGMDTGITHLEWFRRTDGTLALSEIAARPPGAQIMTLLSRAADFDAYLAWARLVVLDLFEVPERKFAVGAAYLRGQGRGRVRAVHGLDEISAAIGHLVTDYKIPEHGQEAAANYEGEGYIIIRHPETEVVAEALQLIVSKVRVELG